MCPAVSLLRKLLRNHPSSETSPITDICTIVMIGAECGQRGIDGSFTRYLCSFGWCSSLHAVAWP